MTFNTPEDGSQPDPNQPAYTPYTPNAGDYQTGAPQPPSPVLNAVRLMYVGAVFQVLGIILGAVALNSSSAKDEIRRQLRDSGQTDDLESKVDTYVMATLAVTVVVGVIALALWIFMARSNAKGLSWARTTATVLGVLGILFALYGVFFNGGISIITNVIAIVLAAAILYFLYRPESTDYYEAVTAQRQRV